MSRTPRTVADLVVELAARGAWLSKSARLLKQASVSLDEALHVPPERNLRELMLSRRREFLKEARASVGKAERLLRDDLMAIRGASAILERQLGERRTPGRPRVVTLREILIAEHGRKSGQSWEQVRRTLNDIRRTRGQPSLTLSTLRSAVHPRPREKAKRE